MSMLSRGAKKATSIVTGGNAIAKNLLGFDFGSSPGVPNPFGVPDLSFLRDPKTFDFLKDLPNKYKPVDTSKSDSLFQDLLKNIGGQNQNDTEQLKLLLGDIGTDEDNTVGSLKSDFQDRGLGGPGQFSDIEANSLAQARSDADRTRAGARTATTGAGLDRLNSAYTARYGAGLDTAKTDAATYNDLLKTGNLSYADLVSGGNSTFAKLMADLYSGGAKNNIDTQQPGYLDSILRNVQLNLGAGK